MEPDQKRINIQTLGEVGGVLGQEEQVFAVEGERSGIISNWVR